VQALLRWMSGQAQMRLRAFLRVVELLTQHEQEGSEAKASPSTAMSSTSRWVSCARAACAAVAIDAKCVRARFFALFSKPQSRTSESASENSML